MPLEALRYPLTPLGLHYVLTHYDIPVVDPDGWRLEVGGLVERELSLSLADVRARPAIEVVVTMECAGNGRAHLSPRPLSQPWLEGAVGTGRWRGVRVCDLLEEAGLREEPVEVVFAGLDRGIEGEHLQTYARSLAIEEALADGPLLAYEVNGAPLPPQHGYPLRLVVPGWYGMTSVKWLTSVTAVAEPFEGHQQRVAYRIRYHEDEEGIPLTRMPPRALMVPPGIPDFPNRRRWLAPGPCVLEGRAWSGHGPIEMVEVSVDGGETWQPAVLERDVDSPWAWCRWTLAWEPREPGETELCCRAYDAAGNVQPDEPDWNVGGYGNNAIQRVPVTVTSAPL
jgi:DMSO/TMAO reductase YedYZ molybdopterin-dependent catalytic subunit